MVCKYVNPSYKTSSIQDLNILCETDKCHNAMQCHVVTSMSKGMAHPWQLCEHNIMLYNDMRQ